MSEEWATKALWARCSNASCGHTWAAAYYPMPMAKMARIVRRHSTCPKCGEEGRMAKQDDGVLLEGEG